MIESKSDPNNPISEQNPDQLFPILKKTFWEQQHLPPQQSFLKEYDSRQKSGDQTCQIVFMDSGASMEFSNNPERDEVLFTFGLNGCIALAVIILSFCFLC